MKTKGAKILNILAPVISIALILILWAVAAFIVGSEYILPSIGATFKSLFNLLGEGEFYLALLFTLIRTLIAFFSSVIIAFSLALLGKKFSLAQKFINPVIAIIRVLPTVAVVLLLLFWTSNFVAPIIVTMLVVLPTTYTGFLGALNSVDNKQIEMCKAFNVPYKKVLFKVQIPQILPDFLNVLGSGLSLNLKLMVAAEVLSQTAKSMGYLLNTSKVYFEVATMMALVLITIIIGVIIELAFSIVSKRVGRWKND